MENKFSKTLLSLSSGLIGVMLTIGYQHFFAPEQTVVVYIDGQKVAITESDYIDLVEQNKQLQNSLNDLESVKEDNKLLQNDLESIQQDNELLQNEVTDKTEKIDELQAAVLSYKNMECEKETKDIYFNGNKICDNVISLNSDEIYVPINLISEVTNESIEYDNNTNKIYIGKNPNKLLYLGEQLKPYKKYGNTVHQILLYPESGSITIAGENYYHGIADSYIFGGTLYFNLDNKYTNISGLYAKTDSARPESGSIKFYDENDNLLMALDLEYDMLPKDFSVDVTGVYQLKIEMSGGFTALVDTIIQ